MFDWNNDRINALTPKALGFDSHKLNPAEWAHERLGKYIKEFEAELDDDHEIGARLV